MNKREGSEWVSLRRAADILGVHPATVRNWAENGKLPFRRTAGNHRRFNINDLRSQVETEVQIQQVELDVIVQSALGQVRMQVNSPRMEGADWYRALSPEAKQALREQGREVLGAIRDYVGAGAGEKDLSSAIRLGAKYAACLSEEGLSLPQTLRGFLYFAKFVYKAILIWSEVAHPGSAWEWSKLMRQTYAFMNAMLLAIVEYYDDDGE